jgi:hypothetical protein
MKYIKLYESQVKNLIKEFVDNVSFEDIRDGNNNFETVYQITKKSNLQSIFNGGFDAAYLKSGGGNMYGRGIYSTFTLRSTLNNLKGGSIYGNTIVKIKVDSFDRFLIFNRRIAEKYYGENAPMDRQIELLFKGTKYLDKIKKSHYYYDIIRERRQSSLCAQALLMALNGLGNNSDMILNECNIRGFIFVGGHDGEVAVIRDMKSLIPVAYSNDEGETWNTSLFSEMTLQNSLQRYDADVFLGGDTKNYKETINYRMINGWMKVCRRSDGKYNFVDKDKKYMSPIWFNQASDIDETGKSFVDIVLPGETEVETFYADEKGIYSDNHDNFPNYTWEDLV